MIFRAIIIISLIIFSNLGVNNGLAYELPEDLKTFFQPVDAIVIMQVDGGVVIDKGAVDGISPGEILTVVKEEEPLLHPETGEILDMVAEYGGYLRITRVKSELSYGRSLSSQMEIPENARLRRFGKLPIYFDDMVGSGFPLFQALRRKFPEMNWQEYRLSQEKSSFNPDHPSLVVLYKSGQVVVLNQKQEILFSKKHPSETTSLLDQKNGGKSLRQETSSGISLQGKGTIPAQNDEGQASMGGGSYIRLNLPSNGEIEALQVADINSDGQPEVLYGLDGELIIARIDGQQLQQVLRYTMPNPRVIIDIAVIDLDGNGEDEIIVSGLIKDRPFTEIFRYTNKKLEQVTAVPMLMGVFHQKNGEPVLIGVNDKEFLDVQPQFHQISLSGGSEIKTEPFVLENIQDPYGVTALAGNDHNDWLASLSSRNKLQIMNSAGQVRWESSETYGGSNHFIKVRMPGSRNADAFEKYYFRAEILKTSQRSFLVAQHEDPGVFKNSPNYENGRLVELFWNGNFLEETWRSRDLGGMIADFDLYDMNNSGNRELIVAVIYQQESFFKEPFSGIVILSLN